jgi:hypothetical protein
VSTAQVVTNKTTLKKSQVAWSGERFIVPLLIVSAPLIVNEAPAPSSLRVAFGILGDDCDLRHTSRVT